jgi:hypothetical protein
MSSYEGDIALYGAGLDAQHSPARRNARAVQQIGATGPYNPAIDMGKPSIFRQSFVITYTAGA